ncbi:MAG: hypothetical protein WA777_20745 [Rhodanobacter sp.]
MKDKTAIRVYIRCPNTQKGLRILNMLRGLANHCGGHGALAGRD